MALLDWLVAEKVAATALSAAEQQVWEMSAVFRCAATARKLYDEARLQERGPAPHPFDHTLPGDLDALACTEFLAVIEDESGDDFLPTIWLFTVIETAKGRRRVIGWPPSIRTPYVFLGVEFSGHAVSLGSKTRDKVLCAICDLTSTTPRAPVLSQRQGISTRPNGDLSCTLP